eukprot:4131933-Prymnesium_polylepis.1
MKRGAGSTSLGAEVVDKLRYVSRYVFVTLHYITLRYGFLLKITFEPKHETTAADKSAAKFRENVHVLISCWRPDPTQRGAVEGCRV